MACSPAALYIANVEVYTDTEFIQKQFPDELYLSEPCIPLGGDVLLHGKRGLGKTQLALTLAIAVMEGNKWLGHFPCLKGNVVYIQVDMPKKLQQDRRRTLFDVTKKDYGSTLLHMVSDSKIDVMREVKQNEPWVTRLREHNPILVIVDTLRKTHEMDENSSDTPVNVYGGWRALCGPRPTIVYVHHDRKSTEFGDLNESFRGSGAWLDECDTGIHVLGKKKMIDRLEFSKLRTMTYPEPIKVGMNPQTLLIEVEDAGKPPVERWVAEQMRLGKPKEEIIKGATDMQKWGKGATGKAMSKTTIYRRLESYFPHSHEGGNSHGEWD